MTSDVVLSAALRNNLLSLQSTQKGIDATQLKLSTGRKVNSALDNPQSFFASQALTNRANDLTRLLDGIGQSIQVIKAADNGITALTKLVEQAQSIAQSAQDVISGAESEAKIVGDKDLRNVNALTTIPGLTAGDSLTFSYTDANGVAKQIGTFGNADNATQAVTIAANQSINELITLINDIRIGDGTTANQGQAFEASLDSAGHLQIKALEGGNFRVTFAANTPGDPADLATASALGFGSIARLVPDAGAANSNAVEVTALAATELRSFKLAYTSNGAEHTADRSTLLSALHSTTATSTSLFQNVNATSDDYLIGINGGTAQTIELFSNNGTATVTVQDFVDSINNNSSLNTKIKASFDDTTGQVVINAIDASVKSIEIGVAASVMTANFGFGVNSDLTGNANDGERESIRLAAATGSLIQYETDFNNIRSQIDALVTNGDTGYRGTNLLNGDNLLSVFNESRTSTLTTLGTTFTAEGLGLTEADFSRESTIQSALDTVNDALTTVRSFGSSLSNSLAVIQARQDFTSNLVNTLKEGSDLLVNADQNEEGAKLLALQTRQSLGVTALSLASQSQQSILRLFG